MSMFEGELALRLWVFLAVLLLCALAETLYPKRTQHINKKNHWVTNVGLAVISSILAKGILPITATQTAIYVEQNNIGLSAFDSLPYLIIIAISVVLLDFIIYTQHILFHRVPVLWRLHKVHHIDQELDVSTGIRFHPIEILLSVLIKCAIIIVVGIPLIAVVIFEIVLNATALFNHSNINLPQKLDRLLRLFVVTPDMHRVHHSVVVEETNSNFGFNLPWWDRLLGTYKAQPDNGHLKMVIGIKEYPNSGESGILKLLMIPFIKNRSIKEKL